MTATLEEGEWSVTRLPLDRRACTIISGPLVTFVKNYVMLVSIGHKIMGVHYLPIFSVTTNTHFANNFTTW